jgi:hypothetical protein
MTAATDEKVNKTKAFLLAVAAAITHWCLFAGRLVVAIGIAYAAARMFSMGSFNLNGFNLPIPRVTAEPLQLAYLAGCIYLVSR